MIEYKNGEFCEAIKCPNNELRKMGVLENCELYCNAFKMHVWLDDNGFEIIKKIACINSLCQSKRYCARYEENNYYPFDYSQINISPIKDGTCPQYISIYDPS